MVTEPNPNTDGEAQNIDQDQEQEEITFDQTWEYQVAIDNVWVTAMAFSEEPPDVPPNGAQPHLRWRLVKVTREVVDQSGNGSGGVGGTGQ